MPNNLDNTLKAAIGSMENTIIPALNKENPLASEQAALIVKLFRFLRERIPYVQQRDWLELKIYSEMVAELSDDIALLLPGNVVENTKIVMKEVGEVLAAPTPEPGLLEQLAEELRFTLSELVRASQDEENKLRTRIESVIVLGSKRVLNLQQAWFVPNGEAVVSASIPDLASQIRTESSRVPITSDITI